MSCNDNVRNICNFIDVDDVQLFFSIAQAHSQGDARSAKATPWYRSVQNGPQFGTLFCQSQNEMGHYWSKMSQNAHG